MSEQPIALDAGMVWRSQPQEHFEIDVRQFVKRRTEALYSITRSEILASIAAAVFFGAVAALRFAPVQNRLQQLWFALAGLWILLSLFWFRDRIWRGASARRKSIADACLDYYRNELQRRRDLVRNAWLWHGPLLLACLMFVMSFGGKNFPSYARMWTVAPLMVLLLIWIGLGLRRRWREASLLQREIDEIDCLVTAQPQENQS